MKERVLIIDDKIENRQSALETISSEVYEVVTAGGYDEGMNLLEKEHFEWVMTDLYMPGTNEVVASQRQGPIANGLVIAIVAMAKAEVKGVCVLTDADAHQDALVATLASYRFSYEETPRVHFVVVRSRGKGKNWGQAFGDSFSKSPVTGKCF